MLIYMGSLGKGCVYKEQGAANIRTELSWERPGLAMDVVSAGSKKDRWQFCLGRGTTTAEHKHDACSQQECHCPSAGLILGD